MSGSPILSVPCAAADAVRKARPYSLSGRDRAIDPRSPCHAPYSTPTGIRRAAAGLTVCNDFGNNVPYSDYLEAFSQIRVPVVFPKAAPNLEPRDDIWPTETAPVFRRREEGVEFVQLRWGFPPARPKGAPVINFRSEGRRFPKGRCLIPASHFFEFTGSEIAEIEVEIHQGRRGLVLLRRPVAADAGRGRRRVHAADDRARPRRGADPRSADGRPRPRRTGWPGSISPGRKPSCCARCPPGAWRSNRFDNPTWRDRQRGGPRPLCRSGSGRN